MQAAHSRPFVVGACCAVVLYASLVYTRGFGWDGDSVANGAQFVRLLNPGLHECTNLATHPKLFMILLFGLTYLLSGHFYLTTAAAIVLNALMWGFLCQWVHERRGLWPLTLLILVASKWWHPAVINADNPAFSVPLLLMGLCFYFGKGRKRAGVLMLAFSSMFRSGAELVLLPIVGWELWRGNREVWPHVAALAFLLPLTWFSYLLGFPDKESFVQQCVHAYRASESPTPYAWRIVSTYCEQVVATLALQPVAVILLAAVGAVRSIVTRSSAVAIWLAPAASLTLAAGAFVYGVTLNYIEFPKLMEYYLVLPFLAGCAIPWPGSLVDRLRHGLRAVIGWGFLAAVVVFAIWLALGLGRRDRGEYEAHVDGSGKLGWRSLRGVPEVIERRMPSRPNRRALVDADNDVFFFLDVGLHVSKIDVVADREALDAIDLSPYDLVLLNADKLAGASEALRRQLSGFERVEIDGRVLLIAGGR